MGGSTVIYGISYVVAELMQLEVVHHAYNITRDSVL